MSPRYVSELGHTLGLPRDSDASSLVVEEIVHRTRGPRPTHRAICTAQESKYAPEHTPDVVERRKDHAKYAVKVVAHEADDKTVWVATAGWDSKVFLYQLSGGNSSHSSHSSLAAVDEHTPVTIGEPVAQISLQTNPESILFVRHVDTKELLLLVSRRDSTYIYYYRVEGSRAASTAAETTHPQQQQQHQAECVLLGRQNLAPHSNAWVAFSPSCMALSPHDAGLLAVATSTLPHMKVMIVRLLFPSQETLGGSGEDDGDGGVGAREPVTQAAQALAALSLQNREDAAIMVQANTFAPLSP